MNEKTTNRDIQARETRKKIITAAHNIFLEKGFENTTISKIAKEAKIGYGTAYVYFKNKHDLFIYLMGDVMTDFFEVAKTTFFPTTADEAISIIENQVTNFMYISKRQKKILSVIKNAIKVSEEVEREWENIRQVFIARITKDIKYVQHHNLADKKMDPYITATSWYYLNELYMWKIVSSEKIELDSIIDQLSLFYTKALYSCF